MMISVGLAQCSISNFLRPQNRKLDKRFQTPSCDDVPGKVLVISRCALECCSKELLKK